MTSQENEFFLFLLDTSYETLQRIHRLSYSYIYLHDNALYNIRFYNLKKYFGHDFQILSSKYLARTKIRKIFGDQYGHTTSCQLDLLF